MTKLENLNNLLAELAELTGSATSKQQAIEKGLDRFLHIDYYKGYGYRLVNVKVAHGGHSGTLLGGASEPRVNYATFVIMLESCIAGLKFKKP